MLKVQVLDKSGNKVKEISAPKEIFSYDVKSSLLYEAVLNYQANQRRGTASTKSRGQVRGSGRKPWKQKGTGRARAGSIRSPLWRKGGITFGPKPRNYGYSLPKKAKKNALKSALSMRLAESQLLIIKELDLKESKTKEGAKLMDVLNLDSALIVDTQENKNLFLSLRNIPNIKTVDYNQVNIYDVLNYKWLVFTEKSFKVFVEKLK